MHAHARSHTPWKPRRLRQISAVSAGLLAGKALELHQLMEARLSDMQAALERAVRVVRRFDVCAQ